MRSVLSSRDKTPTLGRHEIDYDFVSLGTSNSSRIDGFGVNLLLGNGVGICLYGMDFGFGEEAIPFVGGSTVLAPFVVAEIWADGAPKEESANGKEGNEMSFHGRLSKLEIFLTACAGVDVIATTEPRNEG